MKEWNNYSIINSLLNGRLTFPLLTFLGMVLVLFLITEPARSLAPIIYIGLTIPVLGLRYAMKYLQVLNRIRSSAAYRNINPNEVFFLLYDKDWLLKVPDEETLALIKELKNTIFNMIVSILLFIVLAKARDICLFL